MDNTASYGLNKLVSVQKTKTFLKQLDSTSSQQIQFGFTVEPDIRKLRLRAGTFSANFKTHGHLQLAKIFRVSEHQVQDILFRMYIYSYVKCLYSAYFVGKLDNEDDFGYAFEGHSKLFYLIKQGSYSQVKQDIHFFTNIDLGSELNKKIVISSLVKEFTFLSSFTNYVSSFGFSSFIIPELEEKFNYLLNDYYAKRSNQEAEPVENSTTKEKTIIDEPNGSGVNAMGKIKVVKVRNVDARKICDPSNIPLMNCFMNANNSMLYYTEVNDKYEIQYNNSFWFVPSNDIKIKSESLVELKDFYRSMKITKDQDFFVASEVFSNTGIKCKFIPIDSKYKDVTLPIDLPDLVKKLMSLTDLPEEWIGLVERVEEVINEIKTKTESKVEGK